MEKNEEEEEERVYQPLLLKSATAHTNTILFLKYAKYVHIGAYCRFFCHAFTVDGIHSSILNEREWCDQKKNKF